MSDHDMLLFGLGFVSGMFLVFVMAMIAAGEDI